MDFHFRGGEPIASGAGRIDQLGDDLKTLGVKDSQPVAIISDRGVDDVGIVDQIASVLEKTGRRVFKFVEVTGEPTSEVIDAAAHFLREIGESCVIGVGGGSAMDVAKVAAVSSGDSRPCLDYALCKNTLPAKSRPLILIPTTSGTGSEVTLTAIYSDSEGKKLWAWGNELAADLVILDPELTTGLPAELTAATGLDALVHAIEAVTAGRRNLWAESYGLQGIRLVKEGLLPALNNPKDLVARGHLQVGACLAGIAIDCCGTGIGHGLGHAMASLTKIHHGRAVAIGLELALDWNIEGNEAIYSKVSDSLGVGSAPKATATEFTSLMNESGIDRKVEIDCSRDEFVEEMFTDRNIPMLDNNIRPITREVAGRLAEKVLAL